MRIDIISILKLSIMYLYLLIWLILYFWNQFSKNTSLMIEKHINYLCIMKYYQLITSNQYYTVLFVCILTINLCLNYAYIQNLISWIFKYTWSPYFWMLEIFCIFYEVKNDSTYIFQIATPFYIFNYSSDILFWEFWCI